MYKNLTVETILEYGKQIAQVPQYLPDDRDLSKVPRQWLINVIYSIVGDDFRKWVSVEVKNRNDQLADNQNLMIELDPEIAAAFGSSLNISSKFIVSQTIYNYR